MLDPKFILSLVVIGVVGGFDCLTYLQKTNLDPQVLGTILGVLNGTAFVTVVQYWFGSSSGSQSKDATIAKLANGKGS